MHFRFLLMATLCLSIPANRCLGAEAADPARFEREVLVAAAEDPVSVEIAGDGRVFFVERLGALKMWDPRTRITTTLARIPTHAAWDTGMLSLLLARDFDQSGHLYVLRCPEDKHLVMRVARFTLSSQRVDLASEISVLEWVIEGEEPPHCGGSLAWDRDGNMLIGTGDNTPPQDVPAMDPSPGKERFDARRSASNSQDMRGKILRILPQSDGSYRIPAGNLFNDPAVGRPEVFAMGVRNAFRVASDFKTGWIIWGDVGGNVETSLELGPEGFDEINIAKAPGFFGWPFASGPNIAWRPFDPGTMKAIAPPYDMARIVNDSRGNTGLRNLPPAQGSILHYPTTASAEWPILGSGGRSITGGPIYRVDPSWKGGLHLPESLDGTLIFAEWMRNWLMIARLTPEGKLDRLEPFMAGTVFRKPSEIKVGPEGALYVVEYGDRFRDNKDGQIVRCIYRRGNRTPVAKAQVDVGAGAIPLKVRYSSVGTRDPDGDKLQYLWRFPDGTQVQGETVERTYSDKGKWTAELRVTDPSGAISATKIAVIAGNTPPSLRFDQPPAGGFFDWESPIPWKLSAQDAEDGPFAPEKVLVQVERRDRLISGDDTARHPGWVLMRGGTCFACHGATEKSAGPPYVEVARKYASDSEIRERLAQKVLSGGTGVWGNIPMPPHPQHTRDQARQMVDWILGLANLKTTTLPAGLSGTYSPSKLGEKTEAVVVLTAAATDKGAPPLQALRGETSVALRTRKQRAAHHDTAHRTTTQENLGDGLVARIQPGGWIGFEGIQLNEVGEIRLEGRPGNAAGSPIEVRLDRMDGPLLGRIEWKSGSKSSRPVSGTIPVPPGTERHSVFFAIPQGTDSPTELISVTFLK